MLGAQDRRCRRGPARRGARRPTSCRPGRAGRSVRRGRGRACPSRRCWRSPPAAARRRTARRARDRRGGRSPVAPASRRSARPSRRAARPGSRARRRAPRAPSASRPKLVGRRREDDPDAARGARRRAAVAAILAVDGDPAVELGPDDARDEPGGGQRQGRLAGAGPAGDPTRSPAATERLTPSRAGSRRPG